MDDAKDIAQDTLLALWEKRDTLRSESAIKSYLYNTLRNKCINFLQKKDVAGKYVQHVKHIEDNLVFSNHVIEEETLRLFYQAIDALPQQAREVILLTLKGLNREEIGEQLSVTVNTVKYHRSYALKTLRKTLGDSFYLVFFLL